MYLFPVAGALIGIILGAFAFGMSLFLHPLLVGLLVTASLVIITGVHHTDALADFADGLMAKGGKDIKRKAMMDPAVGSAGVAALVLYFSGMVIAFDTGLVSGFKLFASIVAAEVIAKYVMVLLAARGLSAWEGFSSPFTAAMKSKTKIVAATAIIIPILWFSRGPAAFAALAASLGIASLMKYASDKSFGGISGDVLGASNELTRLASLLVMFSVAA
jgi:adenosylcobinamide-GDP ribazoletransferase